MHVRIVISGRGYDVARAVPDRLEMPDGARLADLVREIQARLPDGATLAASSLLTVAGRHLGTLGDFENVTLADGDELVVVAPVAGG